MNGKFVVIDKVETTTLPIKIPGKNDGAEYGQNFAATRKNGDPKFDLGKKRVKFWPNPSNFRRIRRRHSYTGTEIKIPAYVHGSYQLSKIGGARAR